ncbi:NACHT domain-containing protein [Billgrantia bachuensis]|uniref:Short NACHT-associated C-terminal domain-containing protein n=1 Tax=Billgrantia bachuensis TaxID=2717286 RepID=A0ABX0PPG1_9GAMM|nr:hypothetical protein [Halomonas bachuensis]NIC05013.1 hypothetical protein [Halomonas bachuensis]
MLGTILFDNAVKLATPIAQRLVRDKLLPLTEGKIASLFENKAAIKKFEKKSVKYIAKLAGQCSTLNTIAFQNEPKSLNELYIPLTLTDGSEGGELVVDEDLDICDCHDHVLINDTAGMGKSTISKRLVLNIINKGEYIPVFIEMRKLENRPIEEQVAEYLGVIAKDKVELLRELPLLYVFDGMDEISHDIKKELVGYLKGFVEKVSESKILITSRQETFLAEFYGFKHYSIRPLVVEEAYSLIERYDPSGEVSNKLIEGVKRSQGSGIREFLSTPLYVSLLFCSYRHKTVIPQKRHLFYSQVYDALFESHDLSKEVGYVRQKHSKLDSAEFHAILRRLGFWCLKNNGKIEFQRDELEIVVGDLLSKVSGVSASAPSFVKDLTSTVPLFVKEGTSIRWSHKSLMEYFASMFICNDAKLQQQKILMSFYKGSRWTSYANIFELCADIDYSSFRSSVVKNMLEAYIEYHGACYNNITNSRIKKSEIEERISLTFSFNMAFRILEKDGARFGWLGDEVVSKDAKALIEKKGNKFSEIMLHITSRPIHCCVASGREKLIMEIVHKKAPEIFVKGSKKHFEKVKDADNSSLKTGRAYLVNDDPKNAINNSANFSLVNSILWFVSEAALDKSSVEKEIELIKEDESDGIDSLLEGLV